MTVATPSFLFRARSSARQAALAVLAAAPLVGAGCAWDSARFVQTAHVTAPSVAGAGLKVDTRNGSILVHKAGTADGQVSISAELRMTTQERLDQSTIMANRNASGVLEVSATPPAGGWRSSEGCSFDITMPDVSGVELRTTNGKIRIEDLSGRAVLETSNGSITVLNHAGDLDAETSNGRIEATGVAGAVSVRSSNGGITVGVAETATGPIKVRTSNGAVTLNLPAAYRGTLDIQTSNGSIHLPSSAPAGVTRFMTRNDGHSAQMAVGESGPASEVRTSNGSVKVHLGGG